MIHSTRAIPNVTSLALCLQAKALCVCEPKSSDYPLTNFFPVNSVRRIASKEE